MKGWLHRGKGTHGKPHVVLTSANTKTEPWRQDVAASAIAAKVPHIAIGPVELQVTFFMPRPMKRAKKHWAPDVRPDLDKLARAVLDALTGIAWRDDAQVCFLTVSKVYDNHVGADITVRPLNSALKP